MSRLNYTRSFDRLLRDTQGSILPIMAFGIIMLVTAVGVAIDLSREQTMHAKLNSAMDASALAAAKSLQTSFTCDGANNQADVDACIQSQVSSVATSYFTNNYASAFGSVAVSPTFTYDYVSGNIIGSVNAQLPTTFMQVVGQSSFPVAANTLTQASIFYLGQGLNSGTTYVNPMAYGDPTTGLYIVPAGDGSSAPAGSLAFSMGGQGSFWIDSSAKSATNNGIGIMGGNGNDLHILANMGAGDYNPLVKAGDHEILSWDKSGADNAAAGNIFIGPWSASGYGLYVTNSGQVGVNTNAPAYTFDTAGSNHASVYYVQGNTNGGVQADDSFYGSIYNTNQYQLIGSYVGWDASTIFIAGYNAGNTPSNGYSKLATKSVAFGGFGGYGESMYVDLATNQVALGALGSATPTPIATLDVFGYGHFSGNCNPTLGGTGYSNQGQGAYIDWNDLNCTTGETDLINNPGSGVGGFAFILTDAAGAAKNIAAQIDQNSNLTVGGNVTSPAGYVAPSSNDGIKGHDCSATAVAPGAPGTPGAMRYDSSTTNHVVVYCDGTTNLWTSIEALPPGPTTVSIGYDCNNNPCGPEFLPLRAGEAVCNKHGYYSNHYPEIPAYMAVVQIDGGNCNSCTYYKDYSGTVDDHSGDTGSWGSGVSGCNNCHGVITILCHNVS